MEVTRVEQSESSPEGSIESVSSRLLLWCKRSASGFAQVEFVDETARRQVVQRLRTELQTAEIHFEEITLPIETPRQSIANHLVERLRHLSPGVVSVDGFAASLSMERPALANFHLLLELHARAVGWH